MDSRAGGLLLSSRSELNVHGASLDSNDGVLVADAGLKRHGRRLRQPRRQQRQRQGWRARGDLPACATTRVLDLLQRWPPGPRSERRRPRRRRIAAKGDLRGDAWQPWPGKVADLVGEKDPRSRHTRSGNSRSRLIAANGGIAIEARQVDNRAGEISSAPRRSP
ncbi:hypothetical protein ACPA9J_17150 [Pseudomonas aeruginosa]